MNNKLFNVLMFTVGAAVGSLVTWKIVSTRYERILQEEIDSVKETWGRLGHETAETDAEIQNGDDKVENEYDLDEWDDDTVHNYHDLAGKYDRSSDTSEEGGGDDFPYINGPYVIKPEDFADGNFDHSPYCINYYADGVLADDWGVILDIEDTIGEEALEHFGDFAEDVVHVRNERLGADYEVTKDPRTYAEASAIDPQLSTYAG